MTAIESRRYVLAGARARTEVESGTPTFDVRGMDLHQVWQLIKLDSKKEYREWRTAPEEIFRNARSMELRPFRSIDLDFRVVAPDVFELRPTRPLDPGEYALTVLVTGQHWLVVAYGFSVAGR